MAFIVSTAHSLGISLYIWMYGAHPIHGCSYLQVLGIFDVGGNRQEEIKGIATV